MRSSAVIVVAFVTLGCRKTEALRPFRGIEVRVPLDATAGEKDGVLPGPGGLGGIPTGVRPQLDVSRVGPHGFLLQIIKSQHPELVETEIKVLTDMRIGTDFVPTKTADGWELTYESEAAKRVHVLYRDIAGGHYRCTWATANCADPAAAEAVCRSVRPRTAP